MNRDFFELVKAIGESKSKQEEDRIITEEIAFLKKKIIEPGMNKKKMKEYVIRSIYVEMLGQDASFAYIKAVELCASSNIGQKRVGYLAASLFFSPEHEFRFMLINQIQRDLNSSNQLECCAALSAVCKIITPDMIPAVLADIIKLLKHDMDYVRKRAVVAFHRMHQMDAEAVQDHTDIIRRVLCDKDPAVMGASLVVLHDMIASNPLPFKDLVSSFTSILKQVTEHRLPREFDYHRIPAPWVQMNLLRIMALLGRGDQASSEGMYEILVDVMRRADTGINVGYAIVYECVLTITTIYPNSTLLDAAATAISRFIRSDSHNLKYIGIKGLAAIVKDHPKYAADHQMAVIDCLEDSDETLKRKTLDLLFKMTNAVNVEFIVDKLLSSLATATDDHFRTDLVARITLCAERFAPSNFWFVNTMVKIFELAGDKVKMSVAQTLLQLIAEGSDNNEDEDDDEEGAGDEDEELRCQAVEDFLGLLQKPKLPSVLAQAMAWVLGEYGYLSETQSKEEIMGSLCDLCRKSADPITRAYTITALMKLVAQCGRCPPSVLSFVQEFSFSSSLEVAQRCQEFLLLLSESGVMVEVLPVDASCEDIEVDEDLSFLNQFIDQALANGAVPYSPPSYLDEDAPGKSAVKSGETSSGFKIGAYEKPTMPVAVQSMLLSGGDSAPASSDDVFNNLTLATSTTGAGAGALQLGKGVANVWGRKPEPAAPAPSSQSASAATATPSPETTSTAAANLAAMKLPSSATAKEEEEPVVDEAAAKKQEMAAALFGGGGSAAASSRRGSSASRVKRASTAKTTPSPSQQSSAGNATSAPSPSSTPQGDMFDLLDMGGPSPQPVQEQQQQAAAAVVSAPPSDMFGDMMVTSPAQTPPVTQAPPPPPPSATDNIVNLFDAFDEVSGGTSNVLIPQALSSPGPVGPEYLPARLTTPEYGNRWGHTPAEVKAVVKPISAGIQSLDGLVTVIAAAVGIHHIESIPKTCEAIFASNLHRSAVCPAAPVGTLFLVHIKLKTHRSECSITVKSSSKDLCAELNSILQAVVKA